MIYFAIRLAVILVVGVLSAPTGSPAPTGNPAAAWCAALARGGVVIDVLGDSIMEAKDVQPPERRWHALLERSLRADGVLDRIWTTGAIGGTTAADFGPGGWYADRVEAVGNHPDLVIMDWGINDWVKGVPPATFSAQYQKVLDRIRAVAPGASVLLVHAPWVANETFIADHGDQVPHQQAIRSLARDNNTLYLGLDPYFDKADPLGLYAADRLHQSDRGQAVIHTAFRAYLLGLCGRG
ncbi:hypothetical protein GCM10010174_14360 [Kutzneria viridogrisea]|uniref:SGNH hydrolase-type esterase domain-containing protein n=2 Tax=Kutzneria TaxID=43356 RepID=W5WIB8_9PSEU|nr:SGNH/GDSL hydrolase family protein [Kutzneria albida]AHI00939.1 hypothetical protein KALB_7581 [Kutzneria albida DSM 43870]MBA8926216.1 acyl-CoA thioesterase-1 [Kutzneria viridogrisea]